MPKKYRLSGEEIRKLSGKRVHGRFFSMLIAPLSKGHTKCATVVSKKIAAKAVDRNSIKRRCRSILQKNISGVRSGVALVLYAKRSAKDAAFVDLEKDINALLSSL